MTEIAILLDFGLDNLALAYRMTADEVLSKMEVDEKGLSAREASSRLQRYGRNEIPPPGPKSFLKLILKQFEDLLVLILLGAAVVSFLLALFDSGGKHGSSAFVEPLVILTILVANATVGVIQETNAEKAIEKLKEIEAEWANVVRDGRVTVLEPALLVPGDMVIVAAGDKVPADLRLVRMETASITVDESLLTGEPIPVHKQTEAIQLDHAVDQDKRNMMFRSTLVTRGRGVGVVVGIGAHSAIGRIQQGLKDSDDEPKTPLQEKLDEFGGVLSKIIAVICVIVWLINIKHFFDPEHGGVIQGAIYYFKIAVALAVAAIPEGLPAVVTSCLALGTAKMAQKHAIVRSLPSVETLGCTTVICSDKTGTLTTNRMTVQKLCLMGSEGPMEMDVSGSGWDLEGEISTTKDGRPAVRGPGLVMLARIATLCNDAHLEVKRGVVSKVGESTEAALKVLAEKIRGGDEILHNHEQKTGKLQWTDWVRELTLEFHRERKSMSVVVRDKHSGELSLLCKGAPESVLSRCNRVMLASGEIVTLGPRQREAILGHVEDRFGAGGLRCLALAFLQNPKHSDADYRDVEKYTSIEQNMVFVGVAAMMDPPRLEVPSALRKCHEAGIRVIVITGDNKATAVSICRMIGLFDPVENVQDKAFEGSVFFSLPQEDQERLIRTATLFARVEPMHKKKLVDLLQKQKEVVAMTGDGVNDAPALKSADIGIAMGSGTAVAKEASAMVLQDDNFSTIVMAVEEGRAIYANTKGFIRYLISSNIGEVVCIFLTAALGIPEVLIPVQLLWVNLVTDGLPATALGFNKPDADIMRQAPRGRDDPIITPWLLLRYIIIGTYVGIATVAGFIHWFSKHGVSFKALSAFSGCDSANALFKGIDCAIFDDPRPSTVGLSILVTIEMFNTFNALSENQSLLTVPPWSNKWVLLAVGLSFVLHFAILYMPVFATVFSVASIGWAEWKLVLGWSFPIILIDEVLKAVSRRSPTLGGVPKGHEKKQR